MGLCGLMPRGSKAGTRADLCRYTQKHCSQNWKPLHVSIGEGKGKQSTVHLDNGILFSLKKERNSDACYDTEEHWIPCKTGRSQKRQTLNNSVYMNHLEWSNSHRQRIDTCFQRPGNRRGTGSHCSTDTKVLPGVMTCFGNNSDGFTTLCM